MPVEALNAGENPSVYLIGKDNKIEDRPVKTGLETPNRIEITGGLQPGDLVFIGNRRQIQPGASVQPKVIETAQVAYENKG